MLPSTVQGTDEHVTGTPLAESVKKDLREHNEYTAKNDEEAIKKCFETEGACAYFANMPTIFSTPQTGQSQREIIHQLRQIDDRLPTIQVQNFQPEKTGFHLFDGLSSPSPVLPFFCFAMPFLR